MINRSSPGLAPCLHQLFEHQADATPSAVSVRDRGSELSYRDLDCQANGLARALRELGVGPDRLVAVHLDRSVNLMVVLLAILKAGGAYLPIDTSYPRKRIEYMLDHSRPAAIITDLSHADTVEDFNGEVLVIGGDIDLPSLACADRLEPPPDNALAYVIYTSGSTGRPKGVMIEHSAIVNRIEWTQATFQLDHRDRVLQKTPSSFDVSVWEFFWPIMCGATLIMEDPGKHTDPHHLAQTIEREGITTMHFIPSMLQVFLDEPDVARHCHSLRRVLCSGEALPWSLQQLFFQRLGDCELHNLYGPTEAAVDVTHWVCQPEDETGIVPIGAAVSNTQLHILDDDLQPVADGEIGELYLAGKQLGRGYLNAPELTEERFLVTKIGDQDVRVYKTGDLARARLDGNVEYLGREDDQVKIRGVRIELQEVESMLTSHDQVRESAVVIRTGPQGHKQLAAYVVLSQQSVDQNLDKEGLDRWQAIFNETYKSESDSDNWNLAGWNSSYTGQPIPAIEMQEWVDGTCGQIRALKPKRMLEIGCGTGMILYGAASDCTHYTGIDLSSVGIEGLKERLSKQPIPGLEVELHVRDASDFSGFKPNSFDCIVINSAAQMFPSPDYFLRVVQGACELLVEDGYLFLGDLRSFDHLGLFHTSVQFHLASPDTPIDKLSRKINLAISQEGEFAISPRLFSSVSSLIPRLSSVDLQLRRGSWHNELTRFRYNAVLRVGSSRETSGTNSVLAWEDLTGLDSLADHFESSGVDYLRITGIPNARLTRDIELAGSLDDRDNPIGTVNEITALADSKAVGIDPEDAYGLANHASFEVQVTWSENLGAFDLICRKKGFPVLDLRERSDKAREFSPALASKFMNSPVRADVSRSLGPALKRFLSAELPDQMIPASIVILDEMPRSPAGKIDRKALPENLGQRPELENNYEPPVGPIEETLAKIWAEVLGFDRVGVNDNFFDLGGDSLLTAQIVTKARSQGVPVTAFQLFKLHTIAELGEVISNESTNIEFSQEKIRGKQPLTAIQHWVIERSTKDIDHANLFTLLELRADVDSERLTQAVEALVEHQDGLRACIVRERDEWQVSYDFDDVGDQLEICGLPGDGELSADEVMMERMAAANAEISLEKRKLFKFILFESETENKSYLFSTIHQMVIDGSSTRLIIEQLARIYESLTLSGKVPVLTKRSSAKAYAEQLAQMAEDTAAVEFWRKQLIDVPLLPRDNANGENLESQAAEIIGQLSPEHTDFLLKALPQKYYAKIQEVLLAVMVMTLREWTGEDLFKFELESHGRQPLFEGIDITHAIGCFTAIYPTVVAVDSDARDVGIANSVKSQWRNVPDFGISHGLLRYLNSSTGSSLKENTLPEILFNYLGQFDQLLAGQELFCGSRVVNKSSRGPAEARTHLFEVNLYIIDGRFHIRWTYSDQMYQPQTVEALVNSYIGHLERLIDAGDATLARELTPSDFPKVTIDQACLDRISAVVPQISDIIPVTPLQEGMLLHSHRYPDSGCYHVQQRLGFKKAIDPARMKLAWQAVVDRHDILRTGYFWDDLGRPQQVIAENVEVRFEHLDFDEQSEDDMLEALRELQTNRIRGFNLEQPSQMSVVLLTCSERAEMLWNFHHAVLDGFSMTLLTEQVMSRYSDQSSEPIPASNQVQFGDFMTWRHNLDQTAANRYWQASLGDFRQPVVLPQESRNGNGQDAILTDRCEKLVYECSTELTADLQALARSSRITINTIIEGIWGILLSQWCEQDDVVFGAVVLGRNPEVKEIDTIAGLTMNTIPVRLRFDPTRSFLEMMVEHQLEQAQRHSYEHSSLVDIKPLTQVKGQQALFGTIISVQGYLGEHNSLVDWAHSLGADGYELIDWNDFPLSVAVEIGSVIRVAIKYDTQLFESPSISDMLSDLEVCARSLVDQPEFTSRDLRTQIAAESAQRAIEKSKSAKQAKAGRLKPRSRRSIGLDSNGGQSDEKTI